MKFVYHFANDNDIKNLYNDVSNAGLMLPLKALNISKVKTKLLRPLAVSDYVQDFNPRRYFDSDQSRNKFKEASRKTDFHPVITDVSLCSSYNSKNVAEVFSEDSVGEFLEMFEMSRDNHLSLAKASQREYTFIIDTQSRGETYSNMWAEEEGYIARYAYDFSFFSELNRYRTSIAF